MRPPFDIHTLQPILSGGGLQVTDEIYGGCNHDGEKRRGGEGGDQEREGGEQDRLYEDDKNARNEIGVESGISDCLERGRELLRGVFCKL